jgi:hypothetical protein
MASRQAENNLFKAITIAALQAAGADGISVADHLKCELELHEIFTRLTHGDPSQNVQDGNFVGVMLPFVTPAAVNTEIRLQHNLGIAPVGWHPVAAAKKNFRFAASLYMTQDADATYVYMAVAAAIDAKVQTAIRLWY